MEDKSDKLQYMLITVSKHLKSQVLLQDQGIIRLSNEMLLANNDEDLQEINKRLTHLEDITNNPLSEEKVVKFYNLGFLSKGKANAWLDLHAPNGDFGFVIDFHTLMEHIHHAITGVDSLKQLQNVYKFKLNTISELFAFTLFEVSTP